MKKITLVNGPYNGRTVDDGGEVALRMSLSHRAEIPGSPVGEAIYIPNPQRTLAFWEGNNWLGTLVEIIPS